jgi:hypothetical protein
MIRLTYLWTDESVMAYDFARKLSEGMTKFGNAFYARYGFEFNVNPGPLLRRSVVEASKYALVKNGGVSPDLRDADVILEIQNLTIAEIGKRRDAKTAEIDVNIADGRALTAQLQPGNPNLMAVSARLRANNVVYVRLNKERDKIDEELAAAAVDSAAILGRAKGEVLLRLQMANAYHAHRIGSDDRVNIVFCRLPQFTMRSQTTTVGQAIGSSRPLMWVNRVLWPYPFVMINILEAPPRAVAHEIVHIAGEFHPRDIEVFEKISKRIVKVRVPKGSLGGAPFTDLEFDYDTRKTKSIRGGFFDGATNDIMNYTLNDLGPLEYDLHPNDLRRMQAAWFVGP